MKPFVVVDILIAKIIYIPLTNHHPSFTKAITQFLKTVFKEGFHCIDIKYTHIHTHQNIYFLSKEKRERKKKREQRERSRRRRKNWQATSALARSMLVTRMEKLPKRRPAKHVKLGASGQQRYSTPR